MSLKKEILNIKNLLNSQDNRCIDRPIFIVQELKTFVGVDPDYSWNEDDELFYTWIKNDDVEKSYEEGSRVAKILDEQNDFWISADTYKGKYKLRDYTKIYSKRVWQYVTACFTEKGCENYIKLNQHNHRGKLRIYADGSFRNYEFQMIRQFILDLE